MTALLGLGVLAIALGIFFVAMVAFEDEDLMVGWIATVSTIVLFIAAGILVFK